MIFKIAELNEVDGVVKLQSENLISNLSEAESKNGFVTTPFTKDQIIEVVKNNSLFIVKSEEKVIGYAFAGSWDFFKQWPIFPFMTARFELPQYKKWNITEVNSFQYGPICIDKNFRGTGVVYNLFEEMRKEMVQYYPLSATFINTVNKRSCKAHTNKLGWEVVDQFEFNEKSYYTLIYEMTKPVKR